MLSSSVQSNSNNLNVNAANHVDISGVDVESPFLSPEINNSTETPKTSCFGKICNWVSENKKTIVVGALAALGGAVVGALATQGINSTALSTNSNPCPTLPPALTNLNMNYSFSSLDEASKQEQFLESMLNKTRDAGDSICAGTQHVVFQKISKENRDAQELYKENPMYGPFQGYSIITDRVYTPGESEDRKTILTFNPNLNQVVEDCYVSIPSDSPNRIEPEKYLGIVTKHAQLIRPIHIEPHHLVGSRNIFITEPGRRDSSGKRLILAEASTETTCDNINSRIGNIKLCDASRINWGELKNIA